MGYVFSVSAQAGVGFNERHLSLITSERFNEFLMEKRLVILNLQQAWNKYSDKKQIR